MRFSPAAAGITAATLVSAQVGVSGATTPSTGDYTAAQIADGTAFNNVSQMAQENMQYNIGQRTNNTCTYDKADQRQEWRTLAPATRKSFTDAVTCLINMPPTHMTADEAPGYPGVKSRHDEYATSASSISGRLSY